MQFTTHEEAMAYLTKEFVGRGIVTAEQVNAEIQSIVDLIPNAVRETYGDDTSVL
jgi:hypothetical protein